MDNSKGDFGLQNMDVGTNVPAIYHKSQTERVEYGAVIVASKDRDPANPIGTVTWPSPIFVSNNYEEAAKRARDVLQLPEDVNLSRLAHCTRSGGTALLYVGDSKEPVTVEVTYAEGDRWTSDGWFEVKEIKIWDNVGLMDQEDIDSFNQAALEEFELLRRNSPETQKPAELKKPPVP
jgi:hypothetical protein